MSISIYYAAKRKAPLSAQERAQVAATVRRFSIDDRIETYLKSGEGLNWESFCLYDSSSSAHTILEGATKLPDNSEDAIWIGVQHWCAALSELRLLLPQAAWHVTLDDHEIRWDDAGRKYDPTA